MIINHSSLNHENTVLLNVFNRDIFIDANGIYCDNFVSEQNDEIDLRKKVANLTHIANLSQVAKHHSIGVMDLEVKKFLEQLPANANVLDVGGGWGWHWRNLLNYRNDINIFIIDFVYENLEQVKNICNIDTLNKITLIHGDATSLPFLDSKFDAFWSVQTLQHIPNFKLAITESHRVLKRNGIFINYTLNSNYFTAFIYFVLRKHYHRSGYVNGLFWLELANLNQLNCIQNIFKSKVCISYSEHLFHPNFKLTVTGEKKFLFWKIDVFMSKFTFFGKLFARQCMFYTIKN
jgi:ubiquinone/menaquinone biosynthesis C-methylase UbiE